MKRIAFAFLVASVFIVTVYTSCSKGGGDNTPEPANPCLGVTVAVTAAITPATTGQSNGIITASATGGSGFTFSSNGTTFQSSGTFSNLAAGNYTITAKNSNGCLGSATFAVTSTAPSACSGTAGPLFLAVKAVVQANCAVSGCHNAITTQNGINFSNDCDIVTQSARIKVRAVDQAGTTNQMPQPPRAALSVTGQQKITDWVAAGGGFTN
jgi:uncharacterized membrane protein